MGEGVLTAAAAGREAAFGVLAAARWEHVDLDAIAQAVGTPAYVYSTMHIREQYARLSGALASVPHRLHYSVKANSSLAILALIRELGAGVDIVSGGELDRALRTGYTGRDVVFSGVGKTDDELRAALDAAVLLINVESEAELRRLDAIARARNVRAPVALRVNPEVTVDTPHPYTRTGERGMKFGIPYDEALGVGRRAVHMPGIALRGVAMHIGSQVTTLDPYEAGIRRLLELVGALREQGCRDLTYLDVGGGLAVTYENEAPTDAACFAAAISPHARDSALSLVVEPGRFLVGNAGVLLTRVLYRKRSGGREYIITDAGMNDLLRPSHYHAYHHISASRPRGPRATYDVVGPVCESGDFFALDRTMDAVEEGDLLLVHSAGAYGFVMASNYNSRPRPPEILVEGDRFAIVRERETYEDLVRHERIIPDWRRA
ncbi:MAG: diaminopimelate decarboxylase [Gemmatimonadaceae bacterium]